jgi:enamine deaminase RidA (YjgF/YER057c/UK114 family)
MPGRPTKGSTIGVGNPYTQTIQTIKNIEIALKGLGASLADVVRTRIYVTDINNWREVGKAYAEYFKLVRPTATMVEVSRLINPEILVEIEAITDSKNITNFGARQLVSSDTYIQQIIKKQRYISLNTWSVPHF